MRAFGVSESAEAERLNARGGRNGNRLLKDKLMGLQPRPGDAGGWYRGMGPQKSGRDGSEDLVGKILKIEEVVWMKKRPVLKAPAERNWVSGLNRNLRFRPGGIVS